MRFKLPDLRSLPIAWLVFVCPFVLLAPVWLTGKVFFWGTPPTEFIPWWWQAWRTLLSGEVPLWNPLLGMGAPLMANYQSALFYPPTWIYFVLAALGGLPLMAWGLSLLVAAHLAFAGWGMLALLRRIKLGKFAQTIGALAFSLSGFLVAHAQFISINAAIAWLPWILLAAYDLAQATRPKQSVLKLAFFLAMQWLAGHAQFSWYTLLLTAAWFVFWTVQNRGWPWLRQKTIAFVAALLLAFGLSAIQLLPTAEYLLQSQRSAGVDRAAVMFSSFWPWRLIGLFAPNFFGNPATGNFSGYGNYWEDAIYIGLIPLGLALVSLWNWRAKKPLQPLAQFLTGLILVSFLLALGENTPIFPWLFDNVPTFAMFKAPTRFNLLVIFALSLLPALAAERWKPAVGRLGKVNANQVKAFVCILLALDLLYAGWGLNPAGSVELYKDDPDLHAKLRAEINGGRLYLPAAEEQELKYGYFFRPETFFSEDPLALRETLLPNTNLLDQIASVNNFDPLVPARYREWMVRLEQTSPEWRTQLLALMNVAEIEHLLPGDSASVEFEPVSPGPRAYWVNCANVVSTPEQARELVFSAGLDFSSETVVEIPNSNSMICGSGEEGNVELLSSSANRVQLSVNAPGGGWLVLADTWFPGWKAGAAGQELPIYPALGLFRAIELPPGVHNIEIFYSPASFSLGLILSLIAWSVSALLWLRWPKE